MPAGQLKQLKAEIEKEGKDEKSNIDLEALLLNGPVATKKTIGNYPKKYKSYQPMADKIIMVDTSILIDFYRKTDKNNSVWITPVRQGYQFAISAITKYEIYSGATQNQLTFWNQI